MRIKAVMPDLAAGELTPLPPEIPGATARLASRPTMLTKLPPSETPDESFATPIAPPPLPAPEPGLLGR